MLTTIIHYSLRQRFLVLVLCALLSVWGILSLQRIQLDAIPDLSEVQVVLRINYPGQTPQQVENLVTFPLTSRLMAISEATAVRGFSMLGDSYIYIIFAEGTDYDWARTRVLEYVNQAAGKLPKEAEVLIGPEASGVSWIYQYALLDEKGQYDLSQLRSLQDWYLKFELQTLAGVAEVASIGGMVKQYQVVIDPEKQRYFGISLATIEKAIQQGNQESSGSVIEIAEAEYAIHANGYITSLSDLELLLLGNDPKTGTPVLLKDIAQIRLGPQMRRGIAELNGKGEVVGGIIVMRSGENPLTIIKQVEQKLDSLRQGLPDGIKLVTTYDRSQLILRAIDELVTKLWQESLAIMLVCLLFLWHLRSALVAIISLPVGILFAFIIMQQQGISANIMSLGGIAITVGAMVDAAIVMIENLHKHLSQWQQTHGKRPNNQQHWEMVKQASSEVGPALFYSLCIITLSFLPVLLLEAEEGKLFAPLAYTKTYAMAAAAGLAITLVPVLMGYLIRGKVHQEQDNPISALLAKLYRPALLWSLQHPKLLATLSVVLLLSSLYPWYYTQQELMPSLEEGDLLYMPTTLPGLSSGKAQQLLQQTSQIIKTLPEVDSVFGKAGRAETATDPAPLTMLETTIRLKPKDQWRAGFDLTDLINELDQKIQIPGLTNTWVQPIRTRIDMLSTGIRTPLGIKITGTELALTEKLGQQVEQTLKQLANTRSIFSDRGSQGRYIEITPNRAVAAQLGIQLDEIHRAIRLAIGGANVTQTIEGQERYPVNIRYPRYTRDSLDKLRNIAIVGADGQQIPLSRLADIAVIQAPAMIKSENARVASWVMLTTRNSDLASYIKEADAALKQAITLPTGYNLTWVGQYEVMQRVSDKLRWIIPLLLLISTLLLWLIFRKAHLVIITLATLPFSLIGGLWYLWLLDFNFSIATTIGFIALMGIAIEFSIIMLLYLEQALAQERHITPQSLLHAVIQGALTRLRPKSMTFCIIVLGLSMIMLGDGSGLDIMQRIAAPMLGGMLSAPLLSLFIIPTAYHYWQRFMLRFSSISP